MQYQYIVIFQSIVGNPETGYSTDYAWDGQRFDTPEAAIAHGFDIRDSDDFNVGVVGGERLHELRWMNEIVDDDLHSVAEHIGLKR